MKSDHQHAGNDVRPRVAHPAMRRTWWPSTAAALFVIAAIAFAFELVIRSLERALTPWRGKA